MEDGFFILVFIAIAVIQGIGQKRRQEAKKRQGMGAPPRPPDRPRPKPEAQAGASSGAKAGGSSEGLIPADVWNEILGLARGAPQAPEPKTPSPEVSGGTLAPPEDVQTSPRRQQPGSRETTPVSRDLEIQVRDRQPRPRSPEEIRRASEAKQRTKELVPASVAVPAGASIAPAMEGTKLTRGDRGGEGRSARTELFGEGSAEELQKAIILQEVLGPPLALRDEVE